MDFEKHLKVPAQSVRKRENLGIILIFRLANWANGGSNREFRFSWRDVE